MLYIEPNAGVAPVIQVVQQAHRFLDLETYYLSSKPILQAIAEASRRGVLVRVILEEHPYGIQPAQIRREASAVRATGATLHWAPARFEASPGRYVFMHAKFVCSGHACEIGTANFSYAAWHFNREDLYVTQNPAVVTATHAVFQADWTNRPAGAYPHQTLVLSPGASAQILSVLRQPGKVEIESEELGDDRSVLTALEHKGAESWVLLPASISRQDRRNVASLKRHGVHVRLLPKRPLYLHTKDIVGSALGFVGSENFSRNSLMTNRELGILLRNPGDLAQLKRQFATDWAGAGDASFRPMTTKRHMRYGSWTDRRHHEAYHHWAS